MPEDPFRLKVMFQNGHVHIHGNRAGLRDLATTCQALSELSDEDAGPPANHVIYADYTNSADEGSARMMVCLSLDEFIEPTGPGST